MTKLPPLEDQLSLSYLKPCTADEYLTALAAVLLGRDCGMSSFGLPGNGRVLVHYTTEDAGQRAVLALVVRPGGKKWTFLVDYPGF